METMRAELIGRLQRHRDKLVRGIDTIGLWTHLYQMGVITRQHVDMCKSMPTDSEKLEVLLDTMEKRDDDCFPNFCKAVRHNNPEIVSRYLEAEADDEDIKEAQGNSAPDSCLQEMLQKSLNLKRENEKLTKKLDRLKNMKQWLEKDTRNSEILIRCEHDKLREVDDRIQQNQRKYKHRLYELGSRRDYRKSQEKMVKSLNEERETLETDTTSKAEAIVGLTEQLEKEKERTVLLKQDLLAVKKTNADSLDTHHLPSSSFITLLSHQDLNRLDTNRTFIIEACGDINTRELMPILRSLKNATGSTQLRSLDLERETIDQLFNTIGFFSPDNYDSFICSLRKLNHNHIADILDYGGVTVKLVIELKLDKEARRRNPIERLNDISNREIINAAFAQCRCDKAKFIYARVSHPREDNAIEMWIWCMLEDDLRILRTSLDSRSLLKQFERLFAHQSLAICERGYLGKLKTSGKPTSITLYNENLPMKTFCPCLPYGRIVRKISILTPEKDSMVAVIGVVSMDDTAYILCGGSTKIHVFHLENSVYAEELQKIVLPDLRKPVDMTGHDGWLYVLERANGLLWKLNVSDARSQPEKCTIGVMANSLTVTPDGHLLLSVRGPRNFMILCRTADGNPVREISLPSNTDSLWHGLVTTQGEFIVAHRCEGLSRLSLLSCSGQLLKDYSGNPRLSLPPLDTPVHVTADEDGHIFVADQVNQRILYFDSELRSIRTLVNIESGRPNRIHFNQENGHLLVGLDNGCVEIYSVNETKYVQAMEDDQNNEP